MLTSLLGIALACQVVDCHVELDRTYQYLKQAVYLNVHARNVLVRIPPKHWASWVILATNDVPRAQVVVGLATYHGFPLRRDRDAAFGWYRIASKLNEPFGMYLLAEWHDKEHGGSRELAMQWYKRSAELKFATAQTQYGKMLEARGNTDLEFIRYYEMAAELGDVQGMSRLAECYHQGIGKPADPSKVGLWLERAAKLGDADLVFRAGWHYLYTQPDKKKQEEMFVLIKKQAEHNESNCIALMGLYYQEGAGVAKDEWLAVKYFEEASRKQSVIGKRLLAKVLLKDESDNAKMRKALMLLSECTMMGDKESYILFADWCLKRNERRYYVQVVSCLRKASLSDRRAKYLLGMCYLDGKGVEKDEKLAVSHLRFAKDQVPEAMERLGYCYQNGIGTKKDLAEAIKLYEQAAKLGNEDAKAALKRLSSR